VPGVSDVSGPPRLTLDAHISAVPLARHWATEVCLERGLPAGSLGVLQLLVTEAVANSVQHGSGPITVELVCSATSVHVTVHDTSPAAPVLQHVGNRATGGRGVDLIDRLADHWGSDPDPDAAGKTVWFDVHPDAAWPPV
jgi:anti-sigma regulatory factor (Ser/Thr protein kinase)